MIGLKRARIVWTVAFLGVTLLAIVMECVAGLWHPTGWTIPWTEYLARYVPWPVQLVAYVALAVWLPFHFWRHDHLRQVAYKKGAAFGEMQARRASASAYDLGRIAGWHEGVAGKPMPPSTGPHRVPAEACTCLAPAVHGHHCGS